MKKDGVIYYSFPAALMFGFWGSEEQKIRCLDDVLDICAYDVWCKKGRGGRVDKSEFRNLMEKELGLTIPYDYYEDKDIFYRRTQKLREKYDPEIYDGLYWCISKPMFLDFRLNAKTEEERAGLLAYLAIRSIIGKRPFAKTNKYFLTSRMACNQKNINDDELPEGIRKYRKKRYHFDKLKTMLFTAYNVAIYSDKTIRGFYASVKKDADGKPDILWLAQQVNIHRQKKDSTDPLKDALHKVKIELRKGAEPNEQREQHLKNST